MLAAHAHDIEAGQKHELQEQNFINGQALNLHLMKNFQNDFAKNKMAPMKNGHLKVHTQSTLRSIHVCLKALLLLCVYC